MKAQNWNLLKRGGHFHGGDLKQKLPLTEGRVDPRQNGKARKRVSRSFFSMSPI